MEGENCSFLKHCQDQENLICKPSNQIMTSLKLVQGSVWQDTFPQNSKFNKMFNQHQWQISQRALNLFILNIFGVYFQNVEYQHLSFQSEVKENLKELQVNMHAEILCHGKQNCKFNNCINKYGLTNIVSYQSTVIHRNYR